MYLSVMQDGRRRRVSEMLQDIREAFPDGIPQGTPLHFVGEPSWNLNTPILLCRLSGSGIRPVIETRVPKSTEGAVRESVFLFLNEIINILNEDYAGKGVLKLLLGTTSSKGRAALYGDVCSFSDISKAFEAYPQLKGGSKVVLQFQAGKAVDPSKLLHFLPPDRFAIEMKKDITVLGFEDTDKALQKAGYDFYYEDEEE